MEPRPGGHCLGGGGSSSRVDFLSLKQPKVRTRLFPKTIPYIGGSGAGLQTKLLLGDPCCHGWRQASFPHLRAIGKDNLMKSLAIVLAGSVNTQWQGPALGNSGRASFLPQAATTLPRVYGNALTK